MSAPSVPSKATIQGSFRSKATHRTYATYQRQFVEYCKSIPGTNPQLATPTVCTDFFHHLYGQGKTARTVDSAKTALVAYFQDVKVNPNPARDFETKQYVVGLQKYNKQKHVDDEKKAHPLTVYELSCLVNSFSSYHLFVGAMYRFLFCASYLGCFRISEMLNLTWDDVALMRDGESQYVSIRLRWHKKASVQGECQVYHLIDEKSFPCLRVCALFTDYLDLVKQASPNLASKAVVFPAFVIESSGVPRLNWYKHLDQNQVRLFLKDSSKFPWLNANAYEIATDKLLRGTIPNAVKTFSSPTMGSFKVGFFGVMYDMQDSSKGMKWTDPIVAAKEQVKYLRTVEKVDFVIALTHQFLEDDNKFSQEVAGVDMIYGGHDHSAMLQTQFGTPYLKADLDFRNIWFSQLKWYAAKNATNSTAAIKAFTKMAHKNIPITQALPTDAALDAVIAQYDAQVKALNNRTVGSLCQQTDLTKLTVRYKEAPIGNFISDAFLHFYDSRIKVDVSVMNGGGIRTDKLWPAGPINIGDVISWSPFGNVIMVIKTDGASLKKYINSQMKDSCGANGVVAENGIYFHMAGVKYVFACNGKGSGAVTTLTYLNNQNGKTGDVKDTDELVFAVSDFMFDLFKKFAGVPAKVIIPASEATRTEACVDAHVQKQSSQSVCPAIEGRSSIVFA
ncbi:Aste57867_14860 [Aphanomyces stellatus]|uniref:Aste57867_14860 protein n=1 Tax=Aphanomyces stellatus TaxID=120398 RepID=A0A485L2L7_9STRA|nr:hypothetical protein As57867_014804 [Aphanomyces stellatus]VFT91678.1 Aste57867_14860 [Aphanomyces stellatus]